MLGALLRVALDQLAQATTCRVVGRVLADRLDRDVAEARRAELAAVLVLGKRAGDAARPQLEAPLQRRGHLAARDDIRYSESPTRLKYTMRLSQDSILVR